MWIIKSEEIEQDQNESIKYSNPSLFLLKLCGICPKFLKNLQLNKNSNWRNFTLSNWVVIWVGILFFYRNGIAFFGVLNFISASGLMLWSMVVVNICTALNLVILIYILWNQKDFKTVVEGLTTKICKRNPRINKKLYFILAVILSLQCFIVVVIALKAEEMVSQGGLAKGKVIWLVFDEIAEIYLNVWISTAQNVFFVSLCLIFTECIDQLHDAKVGKRDEFLKTIHKVCEIQKVFCKFDEFYSFVLFFSYLKLSSELIFVIPLITIKPNIIVPPGTFNFGVYYGFNSFWTIFYLTFAASSIQRKFEGFKTKLQEKLMQGITITSEEYSERIYFLHLMSEINFRFSVWGFFTVDRKLLLTVLVTSITLIVIVL